MDRQCLDDFYELLAIALCTVLSGGQGVTHMAALAAAKEPFLRGLLKLEHGIRSHDTFSRLFRVLNRAPFREAFQGFMARFSETSLVSGQKVNDFNWLHSVRVSICSAFSENAVWIGIFSNTVTERTCSNV